LDDIPVADVQRFEKELHSFFDHNKKDLLDHIRNTGELPDEAQFKAAIEEFKKGFAVSE
jgi:F-type H+-transporting ATPase subunit alpha